MLLIGHKGTTYCVYGSYHKGMPSRDSFTEPEPAWFEVDRIELNDADATSDLSMFDQRDISNFARGICEAGDDG